MSSHHSSYICSKDAQYAAMYRELSSHTPDEISAMVAAKLRRVVFNQSSRPPMFDEVAGPVMPLLVTSTTLAKLADECAVQSLRIDHRAFVVEQQQQQSRNASSSDDANVTTSQGEFEERFLWRCSLCGVSLLGKPIYSCAAPRRVSEDHPLERFHHFCSDCNHSLRRCCTMSSSSSSPQIAPSCPRCNRILPRERNVVAEAAMQAATAALAQ
jgi:hypothetical protein